MKTSELIIFLSFSFMVMSIGFSIGFLVFYGIGKQMMYDFFMRSLKHNPNTNCQELFEGLQKESRFRLFFGLRFKKYADKNRNFFHK